MTDSDTQIIWVMFGNPTKLTGRFRGPLATTNSLTAGTRSRSTRAERALRIKTYSISGLRTTASTTISSAMRVLGLFPKHDVLSFISRDDVTAALLRELPASARRAGGHRRGRGALAMTALCSFHAKAAMQSLARLGPIKASTQYRPLIESAPCSRATTPK